MRVCWSFIDQMPSASTLPAAKNNNWCMCADASSYVCLLMLLLLGMPQSPLYTSPHWVLGITCPLQHTDAGVEQGAFIVLAQQPLLQVRSAAGSCHTSRMAYDGCADVTPAYRSQLQQLCVMTHKRVSPHRSATTVIMTLCLSFSGCRCQSTGVRWQTQLLAWQHQQPP